jgi:hypothetical protein
MTENGHILFYAVNYVFSLICRQPQLLCLAKRILINVNESVAP